MQIRKSTLLMIPALVMTGCATQQNLDAQTTDASRQLQELRAQQASLNAAQQRLESRLSAVESTSAALKERYDSLASLQQDVGRMNGQLAGLNAQMERNQAAIAHAQQTAEDAIKIARDSRSVAGKVVDTVTLSEDMVSYNYEQPELTASGKTALDALIARTQPLMPHAFIEIIGFTDNVSLGSQNRKVALERAESVRRYLREAGGFPLHRMASISYGDLQPVASNDSLQSRSMNRRVVVQVLQ